jgi:hypothetical protein
MRFHKIITIILFLNQFNSFSQKSFSNLDSLLRKNYKMVSKRDTSGYLSLLNKAAIFKEKNAKTKNDSLLAIKPFKEAFKKVIENLGEMVHDNKFTVSYLEYETINMLPINNLVNGKIIVHVKLLVNSKFIIKMPFVVVKKNNYYLIENPMMILFNDN